MIEVSQYHESPVDRAIREAQERGEFDDLPGAGKPLNLGAPNDPDWWIKGLVQREQIDGSAVLPPGVALRREVERLPQTLSDVRTEAAAREIVEDLNRRILEDRKRLSAGPTILARTVDVDDVLDAWRARHSASTAVRESTTVDNPKATDDTRRRGWLGRLFGGR